MYTNLIKLEIHWILNRKLLFYDLSLLKDTVILDLFSKMHKNDYAICDVKKTVVSNISYDI